MVEDGRQHEDRLPNGRSADTSATEVSDPPRDALERDLGENTNATTLRTSGDASWTSSPHQEL
jgi:hypothetical protein